METNYATQNLEVINGVLAITINAVTTFIDYTPGIASHDILNYIAPGTAVIVLAKGVQEYNERYTKARVQLLDGRIGTMHEVDLA